LDETSGVARCHATDIEEIAFEDLGAKLSRPVPGFIDRADERVDRHVVRQ
jgi:hypothetical protein